MQVYCGHLAGPVIKCPDFPGQFTWRILKEIVLLEYVDLVRIFQSGLRT